MAIDPCQYTGDDPPGIETLEDCAWALLGEGAGPLASAFRLGTFCSTDGQGYPEGRTVRLRHASGAHRRLAAHVDLRTPQVADIRHDARTSWLFYDAGRGLQVRISGHTRVLTGAEPRVGAAWDTLPIAERRGYLAPFPVDPGFGLAPGRAAGDLDLGLDPLHFTRAGTEAGRAHFGLLETRAGVLDILLLGVLEHSHARMLYAPDGAVLRQWVSV